MSPEAVKEELRRHHDLGHRVIPMGNCDNFDYQKGCQGHSDDTEIKNLGIPEAKPEKPFSQFNSADWDNYIEAATKTAIRGAEQALGHEVDTVIKTFMGMCIRASILSIRDQIVREMAKNN